MARAQRPKPQTMPEARLADSHIGLEARAISADHLDVRIWLRLLACSAQIEQEIRARLRQHFGTTLPRFDYLAQLERHPEGLRMSAFQLHDGDRRKCHRPDRPTGGLRLG